MEYKIIADGACDLYGENADKIGNLNISPELLDSILNNKREAKK